MSNTPYKEKEKWDETAALLGHEQVTWGNHWSFNFRNDPKRLAFVLSRYKFAATMGGAGKKVLELGCGEGIGASILAERAEHYTGIDLDHEAIQAAQRNHQEPKFQFVFDDFMGIQLGQFHTVVSLDVCEHIYPEHEAIYFQTIADNLHPQGVAIIGTPNITSAPYASKASQLGHVNLFSQSRLKAVMARHFHHVFPFGMNDETLHTGFHAMAHYIFCVGCKKR